MFLLWVAAAVNIDVTGYLVTPGHAVILLSAAPLSPRACQGSRQKTVLDVGCSFHGAFQGQPPTISKTVPVRKRHRNTVTVGVSVRAMADQDVGCPGSTSLVGRGGGHLETLTPSGNCTQRGFSCAQPSGGIQVCGLDRGGKQSRTRGLLSIGCEFTAPFNHSPDRWKTQSIAAGRHRN